MSALTSLRFILNGREVEIEVDPQMPLLWAVRDLLGLKGTKYGCGGAFCGACTLHVDGEVRRSCVFPVASAEGREVVTIEGLSSAADAATSGDVETSKLHPVQQAWIEENVPQCGYCQPGFMMAAAGLLNQIPQPTDEEIFDGITNICRCGTHVRILKAIRRASEIASEAAPEASAEEEA